MSVKGNHFFSVLYMLLGCFIVWSSAASTTNINGAELQINISTFTVGQQQQMNVSRTIPTTSVDDNALRAMTYKTITVGSQKFDSPSVVASSSQSQTQVGISESSHRETQHPLTTSPDASSSKKIRLFENSSREIMKSTVTTPKIINEPSLINVSKLSSSGEISNNNSLSHVMSPVTVNASTQSTVKSNVNVQMLTSNISETSENSLKSTWTHTATYEMVNHTTTEEANHVAAGMVNNITTEMVSHSTKEMVNHSAPEMVNHTTTEIVSHTTTKIVNDTTTEMVSHSTTEIISTDNGYIGAHGTNIDRSMQTNQSAAEGATKYIRSPTPILTTYHPSSHNSLNNQRTDYKPEEHATKESTNQSMKTEKKSSPRHMMDVTGVETTTQMHNHVSFLDHKDITNLVFKSSLAVEDDVTILDDPPETAFSSTIKNHRLTETRANKTTSTPLDGMEATRTVTLTTPTPPNRHWDMLTLPERKSLPLTSLRSTSPGRAYQTKYDNLDSKSNWRMTSFCKAPTPVSNCRTISWNNKDFRVGTKIIYVCNVGYTLIGPASRVCLSSQSWSGQEPLCNALPTSSLSTPPQWKLVFSRYHEWHGAYQYDGRSYTFIVHINAVSLVHIGYVVASFHDEDSDCQLRGYLGDNNVIVWEKVLASNHSRRFPANQAFRVLGMLQMIDGVWYFHGSVVEPGTRFGTFQMHAVREVPNARDFTQRHLAVTLGISIPLSSLLVACVILIMYYLRRRGYIRQISSTYHSFKDTVLYHSIEDHVYI